jgi:hypothetical protein
VQYWVERYHQASDDERRTAGWAADRPSTPKHQPRLTSPELHDRVCQERRRTGWGPRLIASHSTVSRCLQRRGLSGRPKPAKEVRRFEWPCPGDLLQMDTKRFARFSSPGHAVTGDRHRTGAEKRQRVGYEFCHSIIDDHSRLAYTELHADERAATVVGFLGRPRCQTRSIGDAACSAQHDQANRAPGAARSNTRSTPPAACSAGPCTTTSSTPSRPPAEATRSRCSPDPQRRPANPLNAYSKLVFCRPSMMARPELEPGTPRFSGLGTEVSNKTKSLHWCWISSAGPSAADRRNLRTSQPRLGTRTAPSTQCDGDRSP